MAKATCLLEQGYVLLFEAKTSYKEDALVYLRKGALFLDVECRQTDSFEERELLKMESNRIHDVIQHLSVRQVAYTTTNKSKKVERAIWYLTRGVDILNTLDVSTVTCGEKSIWTFYLATSIAKGLGKLPLDSPPSDQCNEALKLFLESH